LAWLSHKKIGLDIEDKKNEKSLGDIIWSGIYKICPHLNNYYSDYLVDHSKSMNYQTSFEFSNPNYIKIPYPRLIPLYHEKLQFEEPNEQLTELTRQKSNGKKIIVYMPTYRDGLDDQLKLEEQLINLSNIFAKDDRFIFVYKSHFIINKGIANNNFVIYSNRDPYPLLKLSCGLITDYSSIVFDYLPSKKPITMFVFDKDIYKRMPGYYYDIENNFSSIISYDYMETFEKIKNEVFSDKNYDTEKGMIFNNLFSNTFYKGGTFNISIIKQKFIDGHA
jgi:CDP-glycerol glycerophosphotransferase